MPAARATSAYAPASDATVSWALRPEGLGTTHSSLWAIGSGCRPTCARGRPKAVRYAVTPATATTRGRTCATSARSLAPPSRSSSRDSSEAFTVARRTRLVIAIPRRRSTSRSASLIPAAGSTGSSSTPARSSAG